MSHVTTKDDLNIKDIKALARAAEALGCELREQPNYRWWGHSVGDYPLPKGFTEADLGKCQYAIALKGSPHFAQKGNTTHGDLPFEVGVVAKPGGGFDLIWDFYGSSGKKILEAVGNNCDKLATYYQLEVLKRQAMLKGYRPTVINNPNGSVKLRLTRS